MSYEEAMAWLTGKRSMINIFGSICGDSPTANLMTAEADAAMTQQAYWIVKAHKDGLVEA